MLSLDQIDQIEELILEGTRLPFTSGRLVDEQEALLVLDQLRESIPKDIDTANEIVKNKNRYIEQAQNEANDIIRKAGIKRDSLVNRTEVNKEAQRQILEMQQKTKLNCEKLIRKAREKELKIENDNRIKLNLLEKKYQIKQAKLIQEYKDKTEMFESNLLYEHSRLKKELKNEYDHLFKEVTDLKNQKLYIHQDLKNSIEKVKLSNLKSKEDTKSYCQELIEAAKKESNRIKQGSFNYVENTFTKLEENIDKIRNEIIAGKNYIARVDKDKSIKMKDSDN